MTPPPLSAGVRARGWTQRLGLAAFVAGLVVLSGCASLPTFVPDLARESAQPVRLEGSRGPLTRAQSKAVLERLAASSPQSGIFERHLAVEEAIVGSPLTTGNQVKLLQDGPATYRAMFAAIDQARDHINMETYILEDDDVGHAFAQKLIAKQREGVRVNLMYDSVGTLTTPKDFFERLRNAGIRTLEFNPVNPTKLRKGWTVNQRDHRKLLIVDGQVAFLGGINISSVYSKGSGAFKSAVPPQGKDVAWRDTDIELRGPVVAEFQKLFIAAWESQKGEPLGEHKYYPPVPSSGQQVVRAIGSSPDEPYSLIYATFLSAIHSAESSVYVTNAYFVPDPQLLAALSEAAGRGVDVRLILPSQTDSWLVFHAGRAYYSKLLKAGVKIYERRGVILHSKSALIDGVWATVGSTNLDWRSFLHNHELNAVILGADFGGQMRTMFEKDLAESEEITLEKWRQRGLKLRLQEAFSSAWSYWL